MEILTLSGFSPLVLLAIGILLIALEGIFFSFILFWIGVSFIIVSAISFMGVDLDLKWQLSAVSITSLLLLFSLRSKSMAIFLKSKNEKQKDNFLNESGYGVIKNEKVYYKATYWDIDPSDRNTYEDGQKVYVIKAQKNIAYLGSEH